MTLNSKADKHVALISAWNWNLECWFLWGEEDRRTRTKTLGTETREGSWRRDTMAFTKLLPLFLVSFAPTLKSNHNFNHSIMSNSTSEVRWQVRKARLDMKAGGFWSSVVTAFFDVRVTNVNSKCNQRKATSTIFKEQGEEKTRKYQQRVLDVEMGPFTPLVFGTNGGMGADCNCFLKRLAEKLSEKNEEPYHITITWIRTLLSFEIFGSVHTCVRGSTKFRKEISWVTAA